MEKLWLSSSELRWPITRVGLVKHNLWAHTSKTKVSYIRGHSFHSVGQHPAVGSTQRALLSKRDRHANLADTCISHERFRLGQGDHDQVEDLSIICLERCCMQFYSLATPVPCNVCVQAIRAFTNVICPRHGTDWLGPVRRDDEVGRNWANQIRATLSGSDSVSVPPTCCGVLMKFQLLGRIQLVRGRMETNGGCLVQVRRYGVRLSRSLYLHTHRSCSRRGLLQQSIYFCRLLSVPQRFAKQQQTERIMPQLYYP